jgi:hypothetical protein
MQNLKQEAAAKAKEMRVNPRSIKEWQALGDGDLSKIRRLGQNELPGTQSIKPAVKEKGKFKPAGDRADVDNSRCKKIDSEGEDTIHEDEWDDDRNSSDGKDPDDDKDSEDELSINSSDCALRVKTPARAATLANTFQVAIILKDFQEKQSFYLLCN